MDQISRTENVLLGQFGHLFVVIAFIAALFSAFSYFLSVKNEQNIDNSNAWLKLGRWGYLLHTITVIAAFVTLFIIISQHYFEYFYAWRHTSTGLKTKYLFAAFWEGGEGSFLLWLFWQSVIGLIVMFTAKKFETRTMTVIALVQAILTTFILGIYLLPDVKIGTSPFVMLKHEMDAPIFATADYLSKIEGNGLNVLLQNYWMVIHPPVLFLGFALTLVPFAYAVAAVWKGEYKEWIKPTLRWSLLCAAFFGAGIMMGGAWAYESLNFGGYWAWDPVENASLVPWLIMIAAIHTLLIFKSTGRSLKITLIFIILTFILVWYSTFLTRTGVLGETSVHSFTGEGAFLYWHLISIIGLFLAISVIPLIKQWKKMPYVAGEEEISSREFWILIGTIILFIASLQIIFTTSLPVWAPTYQKITGIEIAPPADVVSFYNNIQVWAAFVILIFSGFAQFLKYKKTAKGNTNKVLILLILISLVLAGLLIFGQKIEAIQLMFFAFSIVFALVANVYYFIKTQKANLKKAGGSITHIGFGVMMLGVLISGYNKRIISINRTNTYIDFNKESYEDNLKESRQNVLMYRNASLPMEDYMVTYLGDSTVNTAPPLTYFKVRYDKRNRQTNELEETFYLYPEAYKKELSANPDSKHYLTHDVFTYITSFSETVEEKAEGPSYKKYTKSVGDSIYIANAILVFEGLTNTPKNNPNFESKPDVVAAEANIGVYDLDRKLGAVAPVLVIDNSDIYTIPDSLRDLGLVVKIDKINPDEGTVSFELHQSGQIDDWIVMKAIIFPWIILVWLGVIVMIVGMFISFLARRK